MKLLSKFSIVLLSVLLVGCGGAASPTDVVNDFMSAIQESDFEKAKTFVQSDSSEEFDFNTLGEAEGTVDAKTAEYAEKMISSISKTYKFEKPVEESVEGDTAKVKVKVTSLDFAMAMTSTMGEVMPMAFGLAFSEDSEAAGKQIEEITESILIKNLTAEDAVLATRDVTLNLEKNEAGEYQIVSDENLMEAILANADTIESMFGEE